MKSDRKLSLVRVAGVESSLIFAHIFRKNESEEDAGKNGDWSVGWRRTFGLQITIGDWKPPTKGPVPVFFG